VMHSMRNCCGNIFRSINDALSGMWPLRGHIFLPDTCRDVDAFALASNNTDSGSEH
jgi:hypothetical protein